MKMKVLYVEDDSMLRIATQRILKSQYEVTLAEDGIVALDLIQKEHFDCIISDVEMPGLTGVQLYALIAEKHPEIAARFIFLSGGMNQEVKDTLQSLPNKHLLKPANVRELREAVQEVISGGR